MQFKFNYNGFAFFLNELHADVTSPILILVYVLDNLRTTRILLVITRNVNQMIFSFVPTILEEGARAIRTFALVRNIAQVYSTT